MQRRRLQHSKLQKATTITNTVSNTASTLGFLMLAIPGVSEAMFGLSSIATIAGAGMTLAQHKTLLSTTFSAFQFMSGSTQMMLPMGSIMRNLLGEERGFVELKKRFVKPARFGYTFTTFMNFGLGVSSLIDVIPKII